MIAQKQDDWSSEAYQHSASFVPKLAARVIQWLDPQPEDVILDIGCGDGVLSVEIASILSMGNGEFVGLDSSKSMIGAARKLAAEKGLEGKKCSFDVADANAIKLGALFPKGGFTKIFSNAALHWIFAGGAGPLAASKRRKFLDDMNGFLVPGGKLVFECGGSGNVAEARAALLAAIARRVGFERAAAACPWFFPDEEWVTSVFTDDRGWVVERTEVELRPTRLDRGGVEGWVRLMGKRWFDVIEVEGEREEAVVEAVKVLEEVCRDPEGEGWKLGYVRLRVVARKI